MASSINFRLSPSVLEWARTSMGYTIEQAAKKAGVPSDRYKAWEEGEKLPTYKQLEDLAENVYKRPLAILLLPEPPKEDTIQKDFRNLSNSEVTDLSTEVRLALRRAKRYQLILEEVTTLENTARFQEFKVSINDNPKFAANNFREFLGLRLDEQKSWKFDDAFRNFKQKIEAIGIFIFQLKMPMQEVRAFCLAGKFPIIVLNTDDSTNGRIFSLFHEVCHILLNTSDVFKDSKIAEKNKEYRIIEQFCNQFSASFLVPDKLFEFDVKNLVIIRNEVKDIEIQRLSRLYNVSNEVIARKLLFLKLISDDFFWNRKKLWDAIAKSAKEREKEKIKDQESSGRDQGIKIISEKGKPYVLNVVSAYQQGIISSADLSNYLETKLDHLPRIIQRLNS